MTCLLHKYHALFGAILLFSYDTPFPNSREYITQMMLSTYFLPCRCQMASSRHIAAAETTWVLKLLLRASWLAWITCGNHFRRRAVSAELGKYESGWLISFAKGSVAFLLWRRHDEALPRLNSPCGHHRFLICYYIQASLDRLPSILQRFWRSHTPYRRRFDEECACAACLHWFQRWISSSLVESFTSFDDMRLTLLIDIWAAASI